MEIDLQVYIHLRGLLISNLVLLNCVSISGAHLNWERLKRGSSMLEAKHHHGDTISTASPPQHGNVIC